jgi:lipopolysaccharide transport system ATP-binding protein
MSDTRNSPAISVRGISKAYRIGIKADKEETFLSALVSSLTSPLRNFRRLNKLGKVKTGDKGLDVFHALKNISFEVAKGEVVGIIGHNGAGKSTMLKILARITEPTEGSILLDGHVASLLEVGTGFNPELTGMENIYLNGTILGMTRKEIDQKIKEIIAFSGIEKFIETPECGSLLPSPLTLIPKYY